MVLLNRKKQARFQKQHDYTAWRKGYLLKTPTHNNPVPIEREPSHEQCIIKVVRNAPALSYPSVIHLLRCNPKTEPTRTQIMQTWITFPTTQHQ